MSSPREVTVLGSTGSIGRQAIAVARQNPDRLTITGLAAGGADVGLLAEQALTLGVRTVAVARATATVRTPRASACSASSPTSLPPAARAVMRSRSGFCWATAIACRPMEPVDPSTVTSRGPLTAPS